MHAKKILIDIGSTFTKAVAVDLRREAIVATARAPTTAATDVRIGIATALQALLPTVGPIDNHEVLACSSAAGGLRMISIGLVPDLSSEAAKRAALGAGAKIVGHYSHELSAQEVASIRAARPDVILLAGGTDGGNRQAIVHNAGALARAGLRAPVVVAGNKSAQDEIGQIFDGAGLRYHLVDNVMPEIGVLQVEPCRNAIQEVFIQNIVHAKGLDEAMDLIGGIAMPTPVAVLTAATLLGRGVDAEPGLGEIIVVDVGGATTDVYSIARGLPADAGVAMRGLPEPLAKRTVEGDLGVRHNIDTLLELCLTQGAEVDLGIASTFQASAQRLPLDAQEGAVDEQLARVAVQVSFERHVGRFERVYGPHGETRVQTGKDLSQVGTVVGTGGPIIHCAQPARVLRGVLAGTGDPQLLKPVAATLHLDDRYVMFAMGLLARSEPAIALRMMKQGLRTL